MGSASDMSALNRSAELAQKQIDEAVRRIKDDPASFLGMHVAVEFHRAYLAFEFRDAEIEAEIVTDPDDESLWPQDQSKEDA